MKSKLHSLGWLLSIIAMSAVLTACNNPESDFKKAEQANTEQAYDDFIKKHPDSSLIAQAKAHMEQNAYGDAQKNPTVAAYETFLQRFPSGELAQKAKSELEALEFDQASKTATVPTWEGFIQRYPQSTNGPRAQQHLARLLFQQAALTNTVSAYDDFTKRFSGTEQAKEAMNRIEFLDFQSATNANDVAAYERFLEKYPSGDHTVNIKGRLEPQLAERDWNQALLQNAPNAFREFVKKHPHSSNVRIVDVTLGTAYTFFQSEDWSPRDLDDAKRYSNVSNGAWGFEVASAEISIYPLTVKRASALGIGRDDSGGGFIVATPPSTSQNAKALCVKDGAKYRIVDMERSR
jgi:outer membrane protein assembly factor BamD (BamD/ComL family)